MSTRRGFSLLELLIVIGIIAILATLSIVVMQGTLNQAREDATAMTITKVSELLEERITAFDRAANRAIISAEGDQLERDAKGFFGFPNASAEPRLLRRRVAEIIARKRLFRTFFPQRFGEMPDLLDATGAASPNGIPDDIEQKTTFDPTLHNPVTENAEVLYFMLTQMPVFGVTPVGADAFNSGEVQDTDGDGLPEFVDAWGNPLRFYRWPTRLIDADALDLDPGTPGVQSAITAKERELATLLIRGLPNTNGITRDPLLVDPDDTIGRIGFELLRLPPLVSAYNQASFHTVDVFHTPLIVSAGADGVLGLFEPTFLDADINGNGAVDTGITVAGTHQFYTEDANANGAHDNIFGNLAAIPDGDSDGDIDDVDIDIVLDPLSDNITNRNRRAGGSN